MKFTSVVAVVLSLATFALAAPISAPAAGDISERQNHGMCVSSDGTTITKIDNC
ncbi:hypothetical protein K432DRAFT_402901 [Lepidopterella palustris CBS 459.81]|uniref:Uncharacterized protein n=1 Tax=Lepidopterella palustris CBS 459.81 TaxID=1314670 RepID=A0A8E2EEF2_9PEZI|nr:hypothetical protein K432DRAFT_402901 [Lepidopterella palustris CBS 459.81]